MSMTDEMLSVHITQQGDETVAKVYVGDNRQGTVSGGLQSILAYIRNLGSSVEAVSYSGLRVEQRDEIIEAMRGRYPLENPSTG